jgi:hypothetical protein
MYTHTKVSKLRTEAQRDGRDMAQAVTRRASHSEGPVRVLVSPCEVFGGQSGNN